MRFTFWYATLSTDNDDDFRHQYFSHGITMEEIIDALRAVAIPQTFPMDLPDEDDLVEVEEIILLPIPRSFKDFLLAVSDLVCGSLEPVTVADCHSHTYLPEVTAEAWAMGLARDLMPLCQRGGDYYCVNQEGEVLLWVNGELDDEVWEDVWQWSQNVWLAS